ncbi:hypothetical protein FQA39_LY15967 [Lamprigera yunnana]|nr:hypothetical protein FQA39_LY15967 [Lamprigera yunnana]
MVKMVYQTFVYLLTVVICGCNSAKILGVVPTPSYSHQVPFQPIWKELSLRGHQVTTITTNPIGDPSLVNLTEINVNSSYAIWNKRAATVTKFGSFRFLLSFAKILNEFGDNLFTHPQVDALINNHTETFDVVMVEFVTLSSFPFAERFNCPSIALMSFQPPNFLNSLVGNPNHVVLFPDPYLPEGELSLGQGIVHFIFYLLTRMIQWIFLLNTEQKIVDKYFGTHYPPLEDVLKNISIVLTNSDPILHKPRPLMPNIIQIGGKVNRLPTKPLLQDIESKLNSSTDGFIYFSLGSNVKSKDLAEEMLTTILETFAELPYTILWKFEKDILPNKPDNVITQKWLPQPIILNHPNIKLFIMQGGLQSTEEAIYARVPVVVMPFFGDQVANADGIRTKGFGLVVDYHTLEKGEFKKTILEVIKNPIYKDTVTKFADLAEDQPMTGLEKAIWWTEYVIRHKGAKHLRSPILDVPSYRYFMLDIIAVIILVLIIIAFVLIFLIKQLFKRIFKQKKVKTN